MANIEVDFEELLHAYECVSAGQELRVECYLDAETGKILCRSDETDTNDKDFPEVIDPARYISIPDKYELDLGKDLVFRFAYAHLSDDVGEIHAIFQRRGAYGRFKNLLDRRGVLQTWYDFEEQELRQAPRDWCEANGIGIKAQQASQESRIQPDCCGETRIL